MATINLQCAMWAHVAFARGRQIGTILDIAISEHHIAYLMSVCNEQLQPVLSRAQQRALINQRGIIIVHSVFALPVRVSISITHSRAGDCLLRVQLQPQ